MVCLQSLYFVWYSRVQKSTQNFVFRPIGNFPEGRNEGGFLKSRAPILRVTSSKKVAPVTDVLNLQTE